MRSLFLRSNQLSSLPESVGQLSSLQLLFLRSNQLSSLPESIGQSEEHNPNKPKGQANTQRAALNAIRDDPNLKQRITNAFKAGFEKL